MTNLTGAEVDIDKWKVAMQTAVPPTYVDVIW